LKLYKGVVSGSGNTFYLLLPVVRAGEKMPKTYISDKI
jgi:hypothetical protein